MNPKNFIPIFLSIFTLFFSPVVVAGPQIIIRDAEIEATLKTWSEPILKSAGLSPRAVDIILVQSPELNAFVAGGQNIFLYTGLLQKTETPGEVIGVMAHEMGHIAGGHLVRAGFEMERASYEMILGALLGVGVGVTTGSGDAAAAILSGSSGFSQRNLLAFSRTQESAADQAGLRFMRDAQMNPSGLPSFLKKLQDQELLPSSQQNEYVRTHPLTRDRIATLDSDVSDSPLRTKDWSPEWTHAHARMKAKLLAFITPQQVPWAYPADDTRIEARYARAIAAYRANRVDESLKMVDGLIAAEPNNPYFHELKGQMLYDFGRARASVPSYQRAVALASKSALIKLGYAQARAENTRATRADMAETIALLNDVRLSEPRNTRVLRLLATLQGRMGNTGIAQAWLAEEAFLQGRYDESFRLATNAKRNLLEKSVMNRQMDDLLKQLNRVKSKKK